MILNLMHKHKGWQTVYLQMVEVLMLMPMGYMIGNGYVTVQDMSDTDVNLRKE